MAFRGPIWFILACFILGSFAGCAVKTKEPYIKDGKAYGVTNGKVWRPTWWNFYHRGVSFAEGEYWHDALDDFHEAINRRQEVGSVQGNVARQIGFCQLTERRQKIE